MRKLRLELDELAVESFEVGKEQAEAGTVHGEQQTYTCQPATCLDATCVDVECYTHRPTEPYYPSCIETCHTCELSCNPTCVQTYCWSCPD
jgi:hypothetical protein